MKRFLLFSSVLLLMITGVASVQAEKFQTALQPDKYVKQYAQTSDTLSPVIEGQPYHFPVKQGDFFFYFNRMQEDAAYRSANFDWLRKFKVLKTNGYYTMPRDYTKETKKSDGKTFFYISLNGFYDYEAYSANFGTPPEGYIYGVTVGDYGNYVLREDAYGNTIPASYPDGTWRNDILENHPDWFINPDQPLGGLYSGDSGGYYGGPAYFFNFDENTVDAFSDYMAAVVLKYARKTQYTGLFFDYASAGLNGSFVPNRILEQFRVKYDLSTREAAIDKYNALAASFIRKLRERLPDDFEIFANQSLYDFNRYYDSVDHDLVESYFTSFTFGRAALTIQVKDANNSVAPLLTSQTFYRGWTSDKTDSDYGWVKTDAGISDFVQIPGPAIQYIEENPGQAPKFYFLDYMIPKYVKDSEDGSGHPIYKATTDRNAIYYAYVGSKLLNTSGSNSDWYGGSGEYDKDDVYFIDLGDPTTTGYALKKYDGTPAANDADADYVIRYFENGFVLNTTGKITTETEIVVPKDAVGGPIRDIYDLYEATFVPADSQSGSHEITLSPEFYEMYAGYVNPSDATDVDDGYRPVGRVFMYVDEEGGQ